jgi:hypothetical protein
MMATTTTTTTITAKRILDAENHLKSIKAKIPFGYNRSAQCIRISSVSDNIERVRLVTIAERNVLKRRLEHTKNLLVEAEKTGDGGDDGAKCDILYYVIEAMEYKYNVVNARLETKLQSCFLN